MARAGNALRQNVIGSQVAILRTVTVAIVTAAAAWLVLIQGVAQAASRSADLTAMAAFDPGEHPDVGARLASLLLADQQAEKALPIAMDAARGDPMNVRAMAALALAMRETDQAQSDRAFAIAEQLSRRHTAISLWAIGDAASNLEVERVMRHVDILSRRRSQPDITHQLLYATLSDAQSRQALIQRLRLDPPWRQDFFYHAHTNLPPEMFGGMEAALDMLARTETPPTTTERLLFIDRLVQAGDYARSRAYWIRTFDIENARGIPYDGQFQDVARRQADAPTSPFEWVVAPNADRFVSFQREGGRALMKVTPGIDEGSALISQIIGLAPGDHTIRSGIAQGSAIHAPAGWMVECLPSGRSLIRSFENRGDELSGVTVTVPADCPMQRLKLVGSEKFGPRAVDLASIQIR